jgi:hypothetical protein
VSNPGVIPLPPGLQRRVSATARFVCAAILGGAVAGAVFQIMAQGSFRKGHTELDVNHVLGTAVQGTAEETSSREALGVVGDTAGPVGLYWTLGAAAVLLAVYGLVIARRVSWPWYLRALPLWGLTVIVTGLVFPVFADARLDTPTGLFGTDAGGSLTPLVLILSSLGFALAGERCFRLIDDPRWWEPKDEGIERALESLGEIEEAPSLELAEERPEQRRMGP